MKKEWKYSQEQINTQLVEKIANNLQLSSNFTKILLKRLLKKYNYLQAYLQEGKTIEIQKSIESFLNPSVQNLLFPTFLPNMEKAGQIISEAVEKKEKILIWGDYDADGITATAICVEFFEKHNFEVLYHLPSRKEGYGINKEVLKKYIDEGIKVLISVDCGISDIESVALAKEHNVKVVITDHHTPAQILPEADAIINPHLCKACDTYAMQDVELAGVGVAFFLLCYLNTKLCDVSGKKCDMRDFLDLVALGTIADMVPLLGQNRILVKNGILKLVEARRVSLQALKAVAGYHSHIKLSSGQISFGLAPRINAAGRMENPLVALELLLCKDYDKALVLAKKLDEYNTQRKQEEESIVEQACEQAEKYESSSSLVLFNPEWNQGVIGIVATRIVEKFHKPCFILTKDQQVNAYKGSGRSIPEINLNEALNICSKYLLSYGGHKYAAGLKLAEDKLEEFRNAFEEHVVSIIGKDPYTSSINIDDEMQFPQVSEYTFLKELEMLEPFGLGNAEPVFSSSEIEVKKMQTFGYGKKHLKLELIEKMSGHALHAKLWNTQELECDKSNLCLAYTISLESYNGIRQVGLKIRDMK